MKKKLLLALLLTGVSACFGIGAVAGCTVANDNESEPCAHLRYTYVAGDPATCVENGTIEYWHCEVCGKYFADAYARTEIDLSQITDFAGGKHTETFIEGKAATCQTAGVVAHYHCSVCGKDFDENHNELDDVTIAVNPDAHIFENVAGKEATCEEDGYTAYKVCTVEGCGHIEGKEVIEKLNHDYGDWTYDYANAQYVKVCANDETHVSSDIKAAGVEAEYPYLANSTESLTAALAEGGYIKLTDNVTLDAALTVSKNVTLDLNEKILTGTDTSVSAGAAFNVSGGTYITNITSSSSSAYGIRVNGTLTLSNVTFKVNLISTRSSSSQTFYAFRVENAAAVVTLTNTDYTSAVTSKTNENCNITVYGIYASNGNTTVNGGSIKAGYAIYFGGQTAQVTLVNANIDYVENGINMRYNGGKVVIGSGVTFSGELTNPAIIINPTRNNPQIDDSAAGYNWTLDGTISDCSSYDPVIECYKSGNVIKYVYTDKYAEHNYAGYEYDSGYYYPVCTVCGSLDYVNSVYAGMSEELYYPVNDEYGLKNATLNATAYIKLENDIALTSAYYYELMDGCVLDLNGHTITVNDNGYFRLQGNNVTIKNGTICRPANISYSYGLNIVGGKVTVDGITIDSGINVSQRSTATVKNCTITLNCSQAYYQVCAQVNSTVSVENCKMIRTQAGQANNYFWVENGSSMSVTGCTFESTCGTTYYNKGGVAPTFDFDIGE